MEQRYKSLSLFDFQGQFKNAEDCLIYLSNIKWGKGFILDIPPSRKDGNVTGLNILIDGYLYSFYLNSEEIKEGEKAFLLKEDGTMKMLEYPLYKDKELLMRVNSIFDLYKTIKK